MPGTNCLPSNSQGALPAIIDVTLGLKSTISDVGIDPTKGILSL